MQVTVRKEVNVLCVSRINRANLNNAALKRLQDAFCSFNKFTVPINQAAVTEIPHLFPFSSVMSYQMEAKGAWITVAVMAMNKLA